ncbi:MAG: phosphoribosyl-ATP diphosphatase [Pseudomonadota bacterium]
MTEPVTEAAAVTMTDPVTATDPATMTDPVSTTTRNQITDALRQIEIEEQVRILLAVESGSRAWGFHSPDSDFDVRFIYATPIDAHLSVETQRDVIERPISNELDISGWDLRKTLRLILRSNAVAMEWLRSPVTYLEQPGFRTDLLNFAETTLRRKPLMWHYLRLAESQYQRVMDGDGRVRLKVLFYVIRPVLGMRWLRLHEDIAALPMDMPTLIAEADPPDAALGEITALTDSKRSAKELGTVDKIPEPLDELIHDEIVEATRWLGGNDPEPRTEARDRADAILREWTRRCDMSERAASELETQAPDVQENERSDQAGPDRETASNDVGSRDEGSHAAGAPPRDMTGTLPRLARIIEARKGGDPTASHTAAMLERGPVKCAEKFGEEAIEAIIEATRGDRAALTHEAADVVYHLLVMLAAQDLTWDDVLAELDERDGVSGVAEKASRDAG